MIPTSIDIPNSTPTQSNPLFSLPRGRKPNCSAGNNPKNESFRKNAIILIDSREQKPYGFPGYQTSREKIDTGDYSLNGLEHSVALERKSLPDYLGSIMAGRKRFFNEVKRLADLEHSAIIVEANFDEIINESYPRSETISRNAILGTTQCIEIDFGVPVHWVSDRQSAQEWATWWLERVWWKAVKTTGCDVSKV